MRRIAVVALAILFMGGAAVFVWARWSVPPDGEAGMAPHSWLDSLARLVGLGGPGTADSFSGYVEAEYVLVTSTVR